MGRILHYTKSRLYVAEAGFKVLPSTLLYDDAGKKVAVVVDLIGPISQPFVTAKPLVESPEKLVGKVLYLRKQRRRQIDRPRQRGDVC